MHVLMTLFQSGCQCYRLSVPPLSSAVVFFMVVMPECSYALYQIPALLLFSKEKTIQIVERYIVLVLSLTVKISNVTVL